MTQPVWITPAGSLGTIPEGIFFQTPILAEDPIVVTNVTSVTTSGSEVTLNFTKLSVAQYEIGSTIVVSGFTPSGYNGTYTVTGATTSSVKYVNSTVAVNVNVASVTSTGSTVTYYFSNRSTAPYSVGSSVSISGFMPSGYNGTFEVVDSSSNYITVVNPTTLTVTQLGKLSNVLPGTVENIPNTLFYQIIAGHLPPGIQCEETGLISGVPKAVVSVQGVPLPVGQDVTSKFSARVFTKNLTTGAITHINDRTFTLTVTGQDVPEFITPPGKIATYWDGTQVFDLQIVYTDLDPSDSVVIRLKSGSLPPGLTISKTGLISGLIQPLTTTDPANPLATSQSFEFTLEASDGKTNTLRTFSILVYSRASSVSSNEFITSDNTFVTADDTVSFVPVIISPAPGSLGTVRNDNFYAVQFVGIDLNSDAIEYELGYDIGDSTEIPGLTLDPSTGWLYGYIPNLGITENNYNFYIRVRKQDQPDMVSIEYHYSLSIVGPINTQITWLTDSDLGTIDNGSTSMFYVEAINASGISLQYKLQSGGYNSLPQGLQLLPSGEIAGRASFDTFSLDGGKTTFDIDTAELGILNSQANTTFDLKFTFTVIAYSIDGLISVSKTFSITVNRKYNEPFDNLYIQAMPPVDDRALIDSLLQNQDIFPEALLYRASDPNFGKSTKLVYQHAYGLTAATYSEYVSSLYENHYWKDLTLGEIKVAQALDSNDNVIYEVVYSQVFDNLLNNEGQTVSKQVTLPYPVTLDDDSQVTTVYPNSLTDMRNQVIDTVGQTSNILPLWMLSKQTNGKVLGFTPACVLAYAKPGKGNQIAYYINTIFGERLNLIDFEVDRYELDKLLSRNWDPNGTYVSGDNGSTGDVTVGPGIWVPTPASTTFDIFENYLYDTPSLDTTGQISDSTSYTGNGITYKFPIDLLPTTGTVIVTVNSSIVDYITDFEINYGNLPNYVIFNSPPTVGDAIVIYQISDISVTDPDSTITTETTFDQGSMQFIAPVDMYTNTQSYDKYLVFPKRTILG